MPITLPGDREFEKRPSTERKALKNNLTVSQLRQTIHVYNSSNKTVEQLKKCKGRLSAPCKEAL